VCNVNVIWAFRWFHYCYQCHHSDMSVCRVRALCSNGRSYWHDFCCICQTHVSHSRSAL